jgi:hypothetical protein
MVSLHVIFASLCAASAMRIMEDIGGKEAVEVAAGEEVDIAAVASTTEDVEEVVNGTKIWKKPKQLVVDIAVADARFRYKDEPLLVPGEVIEMAFFDEYRDWTLFTNWRVLEVDGESTPASGYGKDAAPNRVHYKTVLWSKLLRKLEIKHVKMVTATSSSDPDVEVYVGGTIFEFSQKIGGQKHFEIADYLRNKIKVHGAWAMPDWCTWGQIQQQHDKLQNPRICRGKQPDSEVKLKHLLRYLDVPGIGIVAPSTKSLEQLLGPSRPMIKKDETVLFAFTETWSALKRYDDMIITDKQIVTVDAGLPKKKQYVSYMFPKGIDEMFEHFESWTMSTAQRKGADRDCEMMASLNDEIAKKSFEVHFDKNKVSTADLFKYHSMLQGKILAAKKLHTTKDFERLSGDI